MAHTENLSDFFNADTPGYVVGTINGNAAGVLFDNAYIESNGVASRDPIVHAKESDLAGVPLGAPVVLNAVNYKIAAPPEYDGHGVAIVQLKRAT